jgi:hypothetical protein
LVKNKPDAQPYAIYTRIEHWISKAEQFNKTYRKHESITTNDLLALIRHLGTIQYCCLSEYGTIIINRQQRDWIFNHEFNGALKEFKNITQQLALTIKKQLT